MQKIKEVTIYDIARRLDTSGATVSRALQNHPKVSKQTKEKVFAVADELGYRSNPFASNLRTQHSRTIGVLVNELKSNVSASMLSGIEQVATGEGFDLILARCEANKEMEAKAALSLLQKRVDGLIVFHPFEKKNFSEFFKKRIPVFFPGGEKAGAHPSLTIDNEKCGYEATSHLISQGCSQIIHLTGTLMRDDFMQRFTGYKKALKKHGLHFDKSMLISGALDCNAGVNAANKIVAMQELPDGVFAADDMLAAYCLRQLLQHNIIVPDDIAVVGFNNDPICELLAPTLSTMNYPAEALGRVVMSDLIMLLKGEPKRKGALTVETNLIVRQSSLRHQE